MLFLHLRSKWSFHLKFSDFSLNLSRSVFLGGTFGLSDMPFPDFLNGVSQKAFLQTFSYFLIQDFIIIIFSCNRFRKTR